MKQLAGITLIWFPAYRDHFENEQADKLRRLDLPIVSSISKSNFLNAITTLMNELADELVRLESAQNITNAELVTIPLGIIKHFLS